MSIIGVSGKIGSGKDTIGKIIQYLTDIDTNTDSTTFEQYLETLTVIPTNWEIKKYAGKLKDIVCLLIGCTREQLEDSEFKNKELGKEWWKIKTYDGHIKEYLGTVVMDGDEVIKMTPRLMLQLLGTEAGRDIIHPNIWVNALFADYVPISNINSISSVKHGTITHGDSYTRLYSIWKNMKSRCTNSNHPKFDLYGKRGIEIEWKNYESFKEWAITNGYQDSLTLDRIDYDKNYSSSNCRWTTYAIQASNQRDYSNNTSGYRGVYYKKQTGKWCAQIQINKKRKHLGYYSTKEEASEVYEQALVDRDNLYTKEANNTINNPNWIVTDVRFENEAEAIRDRGGILIRVNRPLRKDRPNDGDSVTVDNINYGGVVSVNDKNRTCEVFYNHNDVRPYKWDELIYERGTEHPSETGLDDYNNFNYTIHNNGTIEQLIESVRVILRKEELLTKS